MVFSERGSYIENNESKTRMWMKEHEGVYVLDCWVAPANEARRRIEEAEYERRQGLGWQGR